MNGQILVGDVLEKFKEIPDESIDVVITSPPYWGLRNYGVEGQMGLEQDFNEYLDKLDLIMDECYRVLKPTGTCWINLGDTYSTVSGGMRDISKGNTKKYGKVDYCVGHAHTGDDEEDKVLAYSVDQSKLYNNLKHKSRVGIPERFYIRCIDRGWVARNHIPWIKANSMPSSVRDRFTNKWESVFFFAKKSKGYYFNLDAVRVPPKTGYGLVKSKSKGKRKSLEVLKQQESMSDFGFTNKHNYGLHQRRENGEAVSNCHPKGKNPGDVFRDSNAKTKDITSPSGSAERTLVDLNTNVERNIESRINSVINGKNPGDVFEINTRPYREAHFATFPPTLPEKILKCSCPKGGTVLDPFFGAGTVGLVAEQLDLNWMGIEINPEYVEIAKKRIGSQGKITKHL